MTKHGEWIATPEQPDDFIQMNFATRASIKALAKLYGKEHGLTLAQTSELALKRLILVSADDIREHLDVVQTQFEKDSSSIFTLLDELDKSA